MNFHHSFPFRLSSFVFCLLLLLSACGRNDNAPSALTLTIIAPHGSDIRREFADAFSAWHQKHYGSPVHLVWPDIGGGGTETIVKYLDAAYQNGDSSGNDLIFGGGSNSFNSFAAKGYLVPVPELPPRSPWPSDPIRDVPPDIFGSALHGKDKDGREVWVAATMSAFGMTINKDRIKELGLPTPRAWEDISRPEWSGKLSLADPSKSGSVKTSYEMIFQQYGWEKGWVIITRLFENAALIRDNGGGPPDDVSSAEAVAGIAIDYYGPLAADRAGKKIVAFVTPEGGTALDADPIAMLKGAPNAEVAARFIRFVVSPDGQKIWTLRAGTPGGPLKSSLGRLSVIEDLYKTQAAHLFDPANPFLPVDGTPPFKMNMDLSRQRNPFLGELIKAALIDNHRALRRARQAIRDAGDRPELLAKLEALPAYRPARVEKGAITYGDSLIVTQGRQAALSTEYRPPTDDPRFPYAERIVNHLKDEWREEFAARFAEVERLAK